MHEAALSDIQTDMGKRPIVGIEEHQITRLHSFPGDRPGQACNKRRVMRQFDTGCLLINVADHATAIQTRFRIFAAKTIAGIYQSKRSNHHILCLVAT